MVRETKNEEMNDYQLALISKSVFDIGPRTRTVMLMAGLFGIAMAFMASLDSGKSVPLDKIIHFSGYFTLSATFVLALRPALFIPGLIAIFVMGIGIEFLQRHTGRSFEVADMMANGLGVVVGGMVGLIVRGIYAYVSKEIAVRKARHNLYRVKKGETLIREGDPISDLFIIKSGRVSASRTIDGNEVHVATSGPGEVLGVLGVLERRPQYATLRAIDDTVVYRMSMPELMKSAGGDEQPVSYVLAGLSEKVRVLADQISQSDDGFDADATLV